jgi:glycine cleavage system transcriptional repressor
MSTQKTYLVISALGEDHPGTRQRPVPRILEQGCNIEDSRMTVLGGEFAAILLVEGNGTRWPRSRTCCRSWSVRWA